MKPPGFALVNKFAPVIIAIQFWQCHDAKIMNTRPFNPGFRLSAMDVVVLLAGAIGSILAAKVASWLGMAIAFTVGHFFLFCNVFRMPRPLELAWAALFLLLLGSTAFMQQPGWLASFALSLAGTVVIVVFQMRQPSYHGVGWKIINPQLPQWWQAQVRSQHGG